jgi:hypothetical protein
MMDAVGSSGRRTVQSAVNAVNGVGKVNGFDGGDAVRVEGHGTTGAGNTDRESREDVGRSTSSGARMLAQGHAAIKVEDSHTGSQRDDSVIDQEQTRTSVDQFTERSDRNGQDVKMEAEHSDGCPDPDGYSRLRTVESTRVASSSTPPRSPAERETTPSAPSVVSTAGSKSPLSGGGGGGARVHREGSVDSRGTEGTVATSGTSGRGGGGGGGGEVDREKLLATIEMTKVS